MTHRSTRWVRDRAKTRLCRHWLH